MSSIRATLDAGGLPFSVLVYGILEQVGAQQPLATGFDGSGGIRSDNGMTGKDCQDRFLVDLKIIACLQL